MEDIQKYFVPAIVEKPKFSRYDRVDTIIITYKILCRRQNRIRHYRDTRRYKHGDLKMRDTYLTQSYNMVENWAKNNQEEIIETLYNGVWNNPIHINK
jgi:hypothetical protein